MTERGIETAEGVREFDIVVWATGFDFGTGALRRMGIRGRDGLALADYWADGPSTFLGVQTAGFPNFFFPGGPHAAAGNNPRYNGDQVDFITDTLVYVRDHGYDTIEVDPAAEEQWTNMVDTVAAMPPSFGESSYFFGSQHPRQAAPVPPELGRPAQALQGDRASPRERLPGVQTVALRVARGLSVMPRAATRRCLSSSARCRTRATSRPARVRMGFGGLRGRVVPRGLPSGSWNVTSPFGSPVIVQPPSWIRRWCPAPRQSASPTARSVSPPSSQWVVAWWASQSSGPASQPGMRHPPSRTMIARY